MNDTTVITSFDSLYLRLHDSVTVVLNESSEWSREDYIAAISAGAVVSAVIVALYIAWRDRRDRAREEEEKTSHERLSSLLLLQGLLISSLKRIREFIEDSTPPASKIPTFILSLSAARDAHFSLSRYYQSSELLEATVRALSEMEHVNRLWKMSFQKYANITMADGSNVESLRKGEFSLLRRTFVEVCKHAFDIILDGLVQVEISLGEHAKEVDWSPQAGSFSKYFPT